MEAIFTKYLGPTDTLGSRIKAKALGKSITVSYDCSKSAFENHEQAVELFCKKFTSVYTCKDFIAASFNKGYVFVLAVNFSKGE